MSLSKASTGELKARLHLVRRKATLLNACLRHVLSLLCRQRRASGVAVEQEWLSDSRHKLCSRAVFELERQLETVTQCVRQAEVASAQCSEQERAVTAVSVLGRVAGVYRQALKCAQMFLQAGWLGCLLDRDLVLFGRLVAVCVERVHSLTAAVDSSCPAAALTLQELLNSVRGRLSVSNRRCLMSGLGCSASDSSLLLLLPAGRPERQQLPTQLSPAPTTAPPSVASYGALKPLSEVSSESGVTCSSAPPPPCAPLNNIDKEEVTRSALTSQSRHSDVALSCQQHCQRQLSADSNHGSVAERSVECFVKSDEVRQFLVSLMDQEASLLLPVSGPSPSVSH